MRRPMLGSCTLIHIALFAPNIGKNWAPNAGECKTCYYWGFEPRREIMITCVILRLEWWRRMQVCVNYHGCMDPRGRGQNASSLDRDLLSNRSTLTRIR